MSCYEILLAQRFGRLGRFVPKSHRGESIIGEWFNENPLVFFPILLLTGIIVFSIGISNLKSKATQYENGVKLTRLRKMHRCQCKARLDEGPAKAKRNQETRRVSKAASFSETNQNRPRQQSSLQAGKSTTRGITNLALFAVKHTGTFLSVFEEIVDIFKILRMNHLVRMRGAAGVVELFADADVFGHRRCKR